MTTTSGRTLGLTMAAAAFLAIHGEAVAQTTAAQAVYGRCGVQAETWRDYAGECNLTGTLGGVVPADKQLRIEHIAAVCTGPLDHHIITLALFMSLKPDGDTFTQMPIPLTRREITTTQKVSRYEASFPARLYAGPGTKVEPYLGLESGYVPNPKATCSVLFHGQLVPAQ